MAPPRRRRSNNRRSKKSKASKTTEFPQQTSRICNSPDDILVSVVSLLPLKEAGMTSILSKRWRHVWKYIPTLNFDASKLLYDIHPNYSDGGTRLKIEIARYVHWVDQVVGSHKAPTLDEFRVRFDMNAYSDIDVKCKTSIDSWIKYTMEKRVTRLTIDLSRYYGNGKVGLCYTYPSLSLFSNRLTSLELASVDIAGEVVESILYNCPALESLSLANSHTLESLRVAGPSLSLKYLKLHCCSFKQLLEISAPNLVSFYYFGFNQVHVLYQNVPKLVEVSFGREYGSDLQRIFSDLGCYLSQIKVLKLTINCAFKYIIEPTEYPIFKRLKKLDLQVVPSNTEDDDLFLFLSLIKACPLLHHLRVQLMLVRQRTQMKKSEPCRLPDMKIVEIVGFVASAIDLEFVLYLIENVISLDKVILNTRHGSTFGRPYEKNIMPERRRARQQAELLVRPVLKRGMDLVIV